MLLQCSRYSELKEILPRLDAGVQAILGIGEGEDPAAAGPILENVQDLQEALHRRDLADRYPQVHEVVSFLYLSCFSLLHMDGESFHTYREEVKQRYKTLLRSLHFFPKYTARANRRISSL